MNNKNPMSEDENSLLFSCMPAMRLMTIFTFFFTLSAGIISESQAAAIVDSGTCNAAGTCLWSLDDSGVMKISAAENTTGVAMANYTTHYANCKATGCVANGSDDRPWKEHLQQIEHIVVDDNITSIGEFSFSNAHNLKTITGMNDVTAVQKRAFEYTGALTSVDMPSVTTVGRGAFDNSYSLNNVDMPMVESIDAFAFCHNKSLTNVNMPNVQSIGGDAFADDPALSYINYNPSQVTYPSTSPFTYSACTMFGSSGCSQTKCTNSATPVFNSNPDFRYDASTSSYVGGNPGECVASGGCGSGYEEINGLCKKIPTPAVSESLCNEQGKVLWASSCVDEYPFAKKKYTPTEASEWLKESDNTITLIFKK